MKHHSTVSNQNQIKALGLDEKDPNTGAAQFHDLDEVMASPKAIWKRPWWGAYSVQDNERSRLEGHGTF